MMLLLLMLLLFFPLLLFGKEKTSNYTQIYDVFAKLSSSLSLSPAVHLSSSLSDAKPKAIITTTKFEQRKKL